MAKQSIIIIDDEKSIRESLSLVLGEHYEVQTAGDGEEALAKLAATKYDLALLDIRLPGMDGLEVLKRLKKINPNISVIMITATKAISTAVEALKLGAADYLTKPMNVDDLLKIIERVLKEKQTKEAGPVKSQTGPLVVSVFANKGGVGRTSLAVNLAVALLEGSPKPAVLLDLNIQFGNTAVMLDVVPEKNLFDYLQAGDPVIDDYLTVHSSGLRLLPCSARWEEMANLKGVDVKRIINDLKAKFSYVIIDTEKFLQEVTLEALGNSDLVLYLLSPDIPAVRNASLGLDFLESIYINAQKISLVLNAVSPVKEISDREIADYLGRPVSFNLPHEPQIVTAAANKGSPFILQNPDSGCAKAITEIAQFVKAYKPPVQEAS